MKRPDFLIFQGSTPTLALQLPYTVDDDSDYVYATLSQQGQTVLEYTINGELCSPPPGGGINVSQDNAALLLLQLSQADTLLFAPGDCELQLRVLKQNGSADTLIPIHGYIGKAQKGELI